MEKVIESVRVLKYIIFRGQCIDEQPIANTSKLILEVEMVCHETHIPIEVEL